MTSHVPADLNRFGLNMVGLVLVSILGIWRRSLGPYFKGKFHCSIIEKESEIPW